MKVKVLKEAGLNEALLGLSLSFYDGEEDIDLWWNEEKQKKALKRAHLLAHKQGGHNKFIESMQLWIYVKGTRGWWSEMDTYRSGVTKNSNSTMHTLNKRILTYIDFHPSTTQAAIDNINALVKDKADIETLKSNLPEGFYQHRIICLNYKALQNIVNQRYNHRLPEWRVFCGLIESQIEFPEFVFTKDLP
jgi:hypothetical protein